jgi:ornithine cyclodeaminase/alanine dehydrogenase-like protein (mu-crystallin family)
MWSDIGSGLSTGKKSVLLPPESALWSSSQYAGLRHQIESERLGWKLSTLSCVGPKLAGVKIVGANAANRFFGMTRSFSTILLLDKFTMRPVCFLEGTDLSAARTATYASLVGQAILSRQATANVFLFGGGPIARSICLALDAMLGPRLENLWVRTRSLETAYDFAQSVNQVAPFVSPVADNANLPLADLVITASNAKYPVFEAGEVAATAVVLHLGGDETPVPFLTHALDSGTVVCDDIAMVSARNSQSLALYFSRRGSTLEKEAHLLGVREFVDFLSKAPAPGPIHITCVGVPSLDLYMAEYIYEAYLAASPSLSSPAE